VIAKHTRSSRQQGITSIIAVIFTSILLSIISVSFIALMLREQSRSIDDQLSQSAYDAAMSGVEDGKRVLARCDNGIVASCNAINAQECNTVQASGLLGASGDSQVVIESSGGSGGDLLQAYTCVVINRDTDNYLGTLTSHDSSVMLALAGTGTFNRVKIDWYRSTDGGYNQPITPVVNIPLYAMASWPINYPPVLRAQYIQSQSTINLADYDDNDGSHAVFLYPTRQTSPDISLIANDNRRSLGVIGSPVRSQCASVPIVDYACSATIAIPSGGAAERYLRLTSIYKGASFRVTLYNDLNPVKFSGVQPSIDVNGRANDVYRRVDVRVEKKLSDTEIPYPRATVDITNNFCKDFSVTNTSYSAGSCSTSGP